ncbi:hypothetical protein T492DRAFT_839419 [Pavlovales sp. CCMP2436]|nr:hypothetical protein T492DRAFT_839419 [Pavlovales sp. CCMP2436]
MSDSRSLTFSPVAAGDGLGAQDVISHAVKPSRAATSPPRDTTCDSDVMGVQYAPPISAFTVFWYLDSGVSLPGGWGAKERSGGRAAGLRRGPRPPSEPVRRQRSAGRAEGGRARVRDFESKEQNPISSSKFLAEISWRNFELEISCEISTKKNKTKHPKFCSKCRARYFARNAMKCNEIEFRANFRALSGTRARGTTKAKAVVLAKSAINEFFVANPTIKDRLKSLDESDAAAARTIFLSWLTNRGTVNLPASNNN